MKKPKKIKIKVRIIKKTEDGNSPVLLYIYILI